VAAGRGQTADDREQMTEDRNKKIDICYSLLLTGYWLLV
jgi:hypothetical protein